MTSTGFSPAADLAGGSALLVFVGDGLALTAGAKAVEQAASSPPRSVSTMHMRQAP